MTRERRTNSNKSQSAAPTADKDQESEQDEDNSDFESALATSQAYGLLNDAIHTLDGLLSQQEST